MSEFNDDEFNFDLEDIEELENLDIDLEMLEKTMDESDCAGDCSGCAEHDDPYNIEERSEKLYEELQAKYPDEEEFLINVQKEVTRMILDIVDEACKDNTVIIDLTKQFREEFFIDTPIDFDKSMGILNNIVNNLFIIQPHPSVTGTLMMLPNALKAQKEYGILEFK